MSTASPMMSVATFLEHLEASRLVGDHHVKRLRANLAAQQQAVPPGLLAKWLVDRHWLTPWQADELLAGRRDFFLGKYKLLDRVGAGGSGTVYRCEQSGMDRIVAVKVLSDDVAKRPEAVARFRQEAKLAARVNHANVVAAFDAEQHGSIHFLVMEYVPGQDLNRWIRSAGGRLPLDWACECIRQAALGLQHAHEKGLIHRDIKPGNLLVRSETVRSVPEVKVLDLGFARLAEPDTSGVRLTRAWQIFGTPDYMSPEQAESTQNADARSDIYALGCTLYKALCGEVPFTGATPMQKLLAKANNDAPLVRTKRPEVPPEVEWIVAKMLQRNADDRFQTAQEVAEVLAPFAMAAPANSAILLHVTTDGHESNTLNSEGGPGEPTLAQIERPPAVDKPLVEDSPTEMSSIAAPKPTAEPSPASVAEEPAPVTEESASVTSIPVVVPPPPGGDPLVRLVGGLVAAGVGGAVVGGLLGAVLGRFLIIVSELQLTAPLAIAGGTVGAVLCGIGVGCWWLEGQLRRRGGPAEKVRREDSRFR